MKRIAIIIGIAFVGGIASSLFFSSQLGLFENKTEYTKGETIVEQIEIDPLEEMIQDAIASSSIQIEEAYQKAYENKKEQMEADIALEIIEKYESTDMKEMKDDYKEKALSY